MAAKPKPLGQPACAPDSIERGLRDLADGAGPRPERLTADDASVGLKALMGLTRNTDVEATTAERARGLLAYVCSCIASLDQTNYSKQKAALMAVYRLPADRYDDSGNPGCFDTLSARLQVALEAGEFDTPGYGRNEGAGKKHWNAGVRHLAELVERNTAKLSEHVGWAGGEPSLQQPVHVRSLTVTYFLTGRSVTQIDTERTIEATQEGVDRYIVRAAVEDAEGASLSVVPIFNCEIGDTEPANVPGELAQKTQALLPEGLKKGDVCTFATRVSRRTTAEDNWEYIQVTSNGIDQLRLRIQFDRLERPARCWYVAAVPDTDLLIEPQPEEKRHLKMSSLGFAHCTFSKATPLAKYGLVWSWT